MSKKSIEIKKVRQTKVIKSTTTTTSSDSIWSAIGKHLNLNHDVNSPQVKKEIKSLLANKKEFYRILQASSPYIYYLYTQTQARHLPAELVFISYVESNYNPYDSPSSGARGLWQIMPQTAKELGIKVSKNYDGRLNLIRSTKAALDYYVDLGRMFNNNWYLAIAAYNCGQGRVLSAIKRAKSYDYRKLSLPLETKIYLPRLLAIAAIIKNPEKYGVSLPPIKNAPFFREIILDKSINLATYAKARGISLDLLKKLNPDYRYSKINATKNTNKLFILLPIKV